MVDKKRLWDKLFAVNKDNFPISFSGDKNKKKEFYLYVLYLNLKYIGTELGKNIFLS